MVCYPFLRTFELVFSRNRTRAILRRSYLHYFVAYRLQSPKLVTRPYLKGGKRYESQLFVKWTMLLSLNFSGHDIPIEEDPGSNVSTHLDVFW